MTDAEIDAIVKEASEMKGNLNVIEGVKTLAAEVKRLRGASPAAPKVTDQQAQMGLAFLNYIGSVAETSEAEEEVATKAASVIGRFLSGE